MLFRSDPAVLAHCCHGERSSIFAVHNLSGRKVETTVNLGRKVEVLFDLLKNCVDGVDGDGRQRFRLEPYGYLWMREGCGPESMTAAIGQEH